MSGIPVIDLAIWIFYACKKLIFLVSCCLLCATSFGKMALCFPYSMKLAKVVQLLSYHLTFILLLFHTVLTPLIELFGFYFPLTIILLESLMFMLPMMLLKEPSCGSGWLTICLQLHGSCVGTSIWLRWLVQIYYFDFSVVTCHFHNSGIQVIF